MVRNVMPLELWLLVGCCLAQNAGAHRPAHTLRSTSNLENQQHLASTRGWLMGQEMQKDKPDSAQALESVHLLSKSDKSKLVPRDPVVAWEETHLQSLRAPQAGHEHGQNSSSIATQDRQLSTPKAPMEHAHVAPQANLQRPQPAQSGQSNSQSSSPITTDDVQRPTPSVPIQHAHVAHQESAQPVRIESQASSPIVAHTEEGSAARPPMEHVHQASLPALQTPLSSHSKSQTGSTTVGHDLQESISKSPAEHTHLAPLQPLSGHSETQPNVEHEHAQAAPQTNLQMSHGSQQGGSQSQSTSPTEALDAKQARPNVPINHVQAVPSSQIPPLQTPAASHLDSQKIAATVGHNGQQSKHTSPMEHVHEAPSAHEAPSQTLEQRQKILLNASSTMTDRIQSEHVHVEQNTRVQSQEQRQQAQVVVAELSQARPQDVLAINSQLEPASGPLHKHDAPQVLALHGQKSSPPKESQGPVQSSHAKTGIPTVSQAALAPAHQKAGMQDQQPRVSGVDPPLAHRQSLAKKIQVALPPQAQPQHFQALASSDKQTQKLQDQPRPQRFSAGAGSEVGNVQMSQNEPSVSPFLKAASSGEDASNATESRPSKNVVAPQPSTHAVEPPPATQGQSQGHGTKNESVDASNAKASQRMQVPQVKPSVPPLQEATRSGDDGKSAIDFLPFASVVASPTSPPTVDAVVMQQSGRADTSAKVQVMIPSGPHQAAVSGTNESAVLDNDVRNSERHRVRQEAKRLFSNTRPGDAACGAIDEALPFVSRQVSRIPGDDGSSCIVPVHKEFCFTTNPLWQCDVADSSDMSSCLCRWAPTCHGVTSVLRAADDLPLVCGPDVQTGSCRCRGFDACPLQPTHGWSCTVDDSDSTWGIGRVDEIARTFSKDKTADDVANKENPSGASDHDSDGANKTLELKRRLTRSGTCACKTSSRLPLPLSVSERNTNLKDSNLLAELGGPLSVTKTAAGNSISHREVEHDDNGNVKVVLTLGKDKLTTTALPDERPSNRNVDTKHNVETDADALKMFYATQTKAHTVRSERCVITSGRLSFGRTHWFVLGVVMVPLLTVILLVSNIRWKFARCIEWFGIYFGVPVLREPRDVQGGVPDRDIRGDVTELGNVANGRRPSHIVVSLMVLLVVLLKLNVSQILTTAHIIVNDIRHTDHDLKLDNSVRLNQNTSVAEHRFDKMSEGSQDEGLGGSTAGILIAAEPFGGLIGVVVVSHFLLKQPREVMIGACALVFIGNVGCILALQASSLSLMLLARFVSGLAEGSLFLGQTYLARLSSLDTRTEVFGFWEFGTALGLLGGPFISSVTSSSTSEESVGFYGFGFIVVTSFWLGTVMLAAFPSNQELGAQDVDINPRSFWMPDEDMSDEKIVAVMVTTCSTVVRLLMRLLWEASAVLVLAAHFCLGHVNSGYGATSVMGMYFLAQCSFVQIIRRTQLTDHQLIQACEMMEFGGLLLILRRPEDAVKAEQDDVMHSGSSLLNIVIFLLGSSLFYAGNCLTSAPLNSWGTKRGPREACVLFYNHMAIQSGVCVGPCLARLFTATDPHQNTLVALLIPMLIAQVCLSEIGLGTSYSCHNRTSTKPRGDDS